MTGTIDDETKKAMAEVKANVTGQPTYLGTVIGGPDAGKRVAQKRTLYTVSVRYPAPSLYIKPPDGEEPAIELFTYRHVIILGVHLWVPETWDEQELMAELVGSYRPLKQF